MKQKKIWNKVMKYGIIAIVCFAIFYYAISFFQLKYQPLEEDFSGLENVSVIGELTDANVVVQEFTCNAPYMKGLALEFANYGNVPSGTVHIQIENQGTILATHTVDADLLPDSSNYYVDFGGMKEVAQGSTIKVAVTIKDGAPGAAVTMWTGEKQTGCSLFVNGKEYEGTLVMAPDEYVMSHYTVRYLIFVLAVLALWVIYSLYEIAAEKKEKVNVGTEIVHIFDRYKFLLHQLVGRDFKTRYRRSYLGALWSLLNPIFMMIIVSSVFSFIFRFQIEHFQVYLILGQITFSVFSEATQVSVTTIVGSGQMIKKVYLPKYIFPLSKVTFSFVNFMLSFVAAAGVLVFYRITPTINILYLPLWLLEYYLFTLGISMLLAAAMVFFRDIQHLYSLFILAWGYITPIFYPVDSLAPWMQKLMNLNPLYHYITYLRNILLNGVCPSLNQNIVCLAMAVVSFAIGSHYFHKKQGRFILYI